METNDPPKKYILSRDAELCEECGQLKSVIVQVKRRYLFYEWITELIARLTSK